MTPLTKARVPSYEIYSDRTPFLFSMHSIPEMRIEVDAQYDIGRPAIYSEPAEKHRGVNSSFLPRFVNGTAFTKEFLVFVNVYSTGPLSF